MRNNGSMACDTYLLDNCCLTPSGLDRLTHNLGLFPRALVFILPWILGIEFLNIEILYIRNSVGNPPRDMLIVANNYAGSAWEAYTNHINIARQQVTLIPDRRRSLTKMGIITEDRKSTRLNSSHQIISYALFSFKKKIKN